MHSISWAQHQANMSAAANARATQGAQNALNTAKANNPLATPPPKGQGIPAPPVGAGVAAPQDQAAAPPPRPAYQWTPDAQYNDEIGFHKKTHDDTYGALDTAERNTKFEYGIDDPTNAFSRVAEQKRLFLNRGSATSASMNNRGQLQSGAYMQKVANQKRDQDAADQALRRAYEDALDRIRNARTQADRDRERDDIASHGASNDRQKSAYDAS